MPGGELEFLVTIENTSNNNINDLSVVDDMSAIEVEYYNDTTGPAFVSGTTSMVVESTTVGSTAEQVSQRNTVSILLHMVRSFSVQKVRS